MRIRSLGSELGKALSTCIPKYGPLGDLAYWLELQVPNQLAVLCFSPQSPHSQAAASAQAALLFHSPNSLEAAPPHPAKLGGSSGALCPYTCISHVALFGSTETPCEIRTIQVFSVCTGQYFHRLKFPPAEGWAEPRILAERVFFYAMEVYQRCWKDMFV